MVLAAESWRAAAGAQGAKLLKVKNELRTVPEAFVYNGSNYLLKMLTDMDGLPLPGGSDPFFLRWWADDTTLSALATNGADQVRRMMDAEGTIKRALSAEACKRLSALESTVGLRMASMQQHGALAPCARAVERGTVERGAVQP